jgi:PTH1 family peptidyl-tRNA hydrolase
VILVAGLGNPGARYEDTRHNVGFRVVAAFAERHGILGLPHACGGCFGRGSVAADVGSEFDVGVLQPQTFMNRSGEVVAEALKVFPVDDPESDLIVVFDDVDLPFGRLRIRPSGGSAGHRGLANIIACLGTQTFPRLRFGVDRPPGIETADYVLQPFSESEESELDSLVTAAVDALDLMLFEGTIPAMNRFNRQAADDES